MHGDWKQVSTVVTYGADKGISTPNIPSHTHKHQHPDNKMYLISTSLLACIGNGL